MKKGKRKSRKKALGRLIIICSIAAIVLALYSLFCFEIENPTIWKNVTINGINVKGLTKKEALNSLTQDFQEKYKEKSLTVDLQGTKYTIDVTDVLGFDSSKELDKAYEIGHRGFLLRGIDWILAHTLYSENEKIDTFPHVQDTEKLTESVTASGLPERAEGTDTTWAVNGDVLSVQKGDKLPGADLEKLAKLISKAVDKNDYETVISCPMIDKEPNPVDFQKIHDELYQEKKNATLDKENNYAIVPSVSSISFDAAAAQKQYDALELGGQLDIPITVDVPEVTTESMQENLFKKELGTYTTQGGGSSGRRTNISLAVEACNGKILLPGEEFSYNDVLGERTAERGYQAAGAYSEGEVVEQLGGGICQVSSTLFSAILHTKLEIVTRTSHSMPVSYLPMGMDATVSWGGPEFKFKNNLTYPIKIEATYSGGAITFRILGSPTDYQKIEVEIKSTGEMSCETYRKYYDENGNVTETKRVARSNYKPHS